jgi:hypothetical protein
MWTEPAKLPPRRTPELTAKFEAEHAAAMLRCPKAVKLSRDEYVSRRYLLLGVK